MSRTVFLNRTCPVCEAAAPASEVHSNKRAETFSLEQLRPYWTGLFKEKVFFSYDRCTSCGLLFAPTYFSRDQLSELYTDMAPNMDLVPSDLLEATQRGYWKVAAKAAPMDGGYLEIGPDVGYIVRHAVAEASFDHYWLFEPNVGVHGALTAATQGKPHHISVEMEDLSIVTNGSVGLAVMIQVLDHLLDPREMLERIRAKLKPGGILIIVTHNEASLLRKVMSTRWPPFCLQHPQIYNPDTMRQLVRRAGYASAKVCRSTNYFPVSFMIQQAAYAIGLDLGKLPLPKTALGLKLGNIITLARA